MLYNGFFQLSNYWKFTRGESFTFITLVSQWLAPFLQWSFLFLHLTSFFFFFMIMPKHLLLCWTMLSLNYTFRYLNPQPKALCFHLFHVETSKHSPFYFSVNSLSVNMASALWYILHHCNHFLLWGLSHSPGERGTSLMDKSICLSIPTPKQLTNYVFLKPDRLVSLY